MARLETETTNICPAATHAPVASLSGDTLSCRAGSNKVPSVAFMEK